MALPADSPDLNPTENFRRNIFLIVREKAPSIKDLLTAIWEGWNKFDEECGFKLDKCAPERIMTVKNSRGVKATTYSMFSK